MPLLFIALAASVATLCGGLLALRLKEKIHLILGFSAGAVIGVAFFDLLPEALALGGATHPLSYIVSTVALGFAIYLVVDRLILRENGGENSERLGSFGAGTLSIHSLLDGIGIGLSFKVSIVLGIAVAVAVLAHDFSDGVNTVNFVLKNGGERKRAFRWLIVDALAPVVGVLSTLYFTISGDTLGLLLALFSGFFLYIGASDLVPESHQAHPMIWTTVATLLGMLMMFIIISVAG